MTILNMRYTPYRIPFRQSFTTTHGTLTTRTGAIVEVHTTNGISGIGEIAPLPGFSRETLGEALAPLSTLAAQLQGKQLAQALQILSQVAGSFPASLVYGLETALLDAMSKQEGYQLAALLVKLSAHQTHEENNSIRQTQRGQNQCGQTQRRGEGGVDVWSGPAGSPRSAGTQVRGHGNDGGAVHSQLPPNSDVTRPGRPFGPSSPPYPALAPTLGSSSSYELLGSSSPYEFGNARQMPVNAVIGANTIEETVKGAQSAVAAGFTCLKLKMATGSPKEIERIAAVRAAVGPTIQLRLDANEGWNYEQALTILSLCTPLAIEYVEQPLPAHDLDGMHRLRHATSIPIAADEALSDLESARRILAAEAADIFIIKPQAAGGLCTAQQMIQEAAQRGIQSVVTSMLETGIGVTAALHLAIANGITLACGLATLPLLVDDLLLDDLLIHNGALELPASSGLGVQLDRAGLEKYKLHEVSSGYC